MRPTQLLVLGSLLFIGCGTPRAPVGEAGSGGSSSATGGNTETGGGPGSDSSASATSTSGPATGSSTVGSTSTTSPDLESSSGAECEKADCGACPPPLVNAEYCIGGEFICACEFQRPCNVLEVACAYLELDPSAKDNGVDCGVATLGDSLRDWQAVTACVQDSAMNELAFKGAFQLPGIDTSVYTGFVGRTGAAYELTELFADSPGLGNRVDARACNAIAPIACPPEVGEMCLECNTQAEFANICRDNPE